MITAISPGMIQISLKDANGKVDEYRTIDPDEHANTYEAIAKAAIDLIAGAAELYVGDTITITITEP